MNEYVFLKVCLSQKFPKDFDILFLMYIICADQFSLLSMIIHRRLVLFVRLMELLLILYPYVVIVF